MTEKFAFTSKRFYRLRFHNAICHIILLLVVLSCLLVMSCFRHILLKKAGLDSGLWTLEPGLRTSPPNKKNVKKLLQIILPCHLLKFCRKRNRKKCFCGQTRMSMRDIDRSEKHLPHIARFYQFLFTPG